MKRNRISLCFALYAALIFVSCAEKHAELPSPIVQAAEKAGAGDLSNVTKQAMEEWLGKHRSVTDTIETMCKPVRQNATAEWADSTEGRLCGASHDLAFFRSAPVTGDGKTFRPGVH